MFIKKLTCVLIALVLMGCGSTPYRDDYTQYVNVLPSKAVAESDYKFVFANGDKVDLRGQYERNNTTETANMLYMGDAGLIGLIAQVGTHATIVSSQRNDKLAKQQNAANEQIGDLLSVVDTMSLAQLAKPHLPGTVDDSQPSPTTVYINPIFFSNTDKSRFTLNAMVWIPSKGKNKRRKKEAFTYRNLVQVYPAVFTKEEMTLVKNGDKAFIEAKLSEMLVKALDITKSAITGGFLPAKQKLETVKISKKAGFKIVRGRVLEKTCRYNIIQDLHSWYIAYPATESTGTCLSKK